MQKSRKAAWGRSQKSTPDPYTSMQLAGQEGGVEHKPTKSHQATCPQHGDVPCQGDLPYAFLGFVFVFNGIDLKHCSVLF